MPILPTHIDVTYPDSPSDASVQRHQSYHDALHALNNSAGQPLGLATTGADGFLTAAQQPPGVAVNAQAASYTLVLADAGKLVEMNAAAANTLTIPPNSAVAVPVGTIIEVSMYGAGVTTVTAGTGVTLRTALASLALAQYGSVSLRKRATDEWVVS